MTSKGEKKLAFAKAYTGNNLYQLNYLGQDDPAGGKPYHYGRKMDKKMNKLRADRFLKDLIKLEEDYKNNFNNQEDASDPPSAIPSQIPSPTSPEVKKIPGLEPVKRKGAAAKIKQVVLGVLGVGYSKGTSNRNAAKSVCWRPNRQSNVKTDNRQSDVKMDKSDSKTAWDTPPPTPPVSASEKKIEALWLKYRLAEGERWADVSEDDEFPVAKPKITEEGAPEEKEAGGPAKIKDSSQNPPTTEPPAEPLEPLWRRRPHWRRRHMKEMACTTQFEPQWKQHIIKLDAPASAPPYVIKDVYFKQKFKKKEKKYKKKENGTSSTESQTSMDSQPNSSSAASSSGAERTMPAESA